MSKTLVCKNKLLIIIVIIVIIKLRNINVQMMSNLKLLQKKIF